MIYLLLKEISEERKALVGAILYIFNLHVAFVSGWWGMFDGIVSFFVTLALYLLCKEKNIWAGFAMGLALLTKQTAIPIFIVLAGLLMKRNLQHSKDFSLTAISTFLVPVLPFLISSPEKKLGALYYNLPSHEMRGRVGAIWYLLRHLAHTLDQPWAVDFLGRIHFYVFYTSLILPLLITLRLYGKVDFPILLNKGALLASINFLTFTPQLHTPYLVPFISFLCIAIALSDVNPLWYAVPIYYSEGIYYFTAPALFPHIHLSYHTYSLIRVCLLVIAYVIILHENLTIASFQEKTSPKGCPDALSQRDCDINSTPSR
jgi:Gpi18-like mannosyltransferase